MSYCKLIIIGNLTSTPELIRTKGAPICKGSVAFDAHQKRADGSWGKEPVYLDFKIFGARAEPYAKYHEKGRVTLLEGHLRLDQWTDKNGAKRKAHYMVVDRWEFMGADVVEYSDVPPSEGPADDDVDLGDPF